MDGGLVDLEQAAGLARRDVHNRVRAVSGDGLERLDGSTGGAVQARVDPRTVKQYEAGSTCAACRSTS